MILSKNTLSAIKNVSLPAKEYFNLPEKVLQFGAGVLLRGLPDYFIHEANAQGIFNGRIVVVKSTAGDTGDFDRQDGLFLHRMCGIERGEPMQRTILNAAISRVLSASRDWPSILDYAASPQLAVIISNTTEIGITLTDDDVHASPPNSFPGKLLAALLHRYRMLGGTADTGLVIIPTELLPDNGTQLKNILEQLARQNHLEDHFIHWLTEHNDFCSSLVDRIVPGKPDPVQQCVVETEAGVADKLMIVSEPYALWAIECRSEKSRSVLSFSEATKGVVLAPDISVFRELKLRLLNGTHTFCCGLAYLLGFDTVKESMDDAGFERFLSGLMHDEIAPAITGVNITEADVAAFAASVIERFRNPFIAHRWLAITLQYSSKMATRNVPLIQAYYERFSRVPDFMARGFAAHLLFMKGSPQSDGTYYGIRNDEPYLINDDRAPVYTTAWEEGDPSLATTRILTNRQLWGIDLNSFPGFAERVLQHLHELMRIA